MTSQAGQEVPVQDILSWVYEQLGKETIIDVGFQLKTVLLGVVSFSLGNFATILATVGNITFQVILYLTLVLYFLDLDGSIMSRSLRSIVVEQEVRMHIESEAKEMIAGLFVINFKGALLQAIYTGMILDIFGVKCVFLYALVAAFLKTVPFMSTWLVGLVSALQFLL